MLHSAFMIRLLIFLTCIFYLNFLSRIIIAPLLPFLERSMALTHAQSSSFFMFLSAGYFIAILGSGFVSARTGHRNTISLSAMLIACSVFMTSFASSLLEMRAGFFCMGFSAGLYLPSAIAVISAECPQNIWGRAFSVHELAPNLAFISAPFIVALLLDHCSWQNMFRFQAAVLGAAGILFLFLSKGRKEYGTPPDLAGISGVVRVSGFAMMIVMFSMGILGTLGVFNLLPLFLVNVHGMNDAAANSITGFSRVATLVAALTGGWISDRLGAVRTMGGVLVISGLLVVIMGSASGYILYACVFLQPVIAVCFFPAAFSALSSLVPAGLRNLVISLVVPLAYVAGGGGIPWFIGWLADMGCFSLGISMAGAFMAAAGCLALVLKSSEADPGL